MLVADLSCGADGSSKDPGGQRLSLVLRGRQSKGVNDIPGFSTRLHNDWDLKSMS